MTDFERWLVAEAHRHGLSALTVEEADPERLRDYCRSVLGELVARGLLPGRPEPGCYAAPRATGN